MEFRRITPSDVEHVINFAMLGMRPERYPLHVSRTRVRAVVEHFVMSQGDFHLAAFDGGRMVGGIAVLVSQMLWFQRAEAHVVMFFAVVPGVGRRLLREAMRWFRDNAGLRRMHWPLEDDAQVERLTRMGRRAGFNRQHSVLLAYKE